ncbi:unnamed protein product [Penicillium glandicola]
MFLDAGTRELNSRDSKWGTTPLIWAAKRGNIEVVKLLLEQAEIGVDIPTFDHHTPLSYAAENGHSETVRLLLDKGADPDGDKLAPFPPIVYAANNSHLGAFENLLTTTKLNIGSQYNCGETLLSMAALGGHDLVVEALLRTPNVNPDSRDFFNHLDVRDQLEDSTPLLEAAELGFEEIVEHLIKAGAKVSDCVERGPRRTALSFAAEKGNENIVKLLLKTGLANPNSQSSLGRTPLSYAASEGYSGIVRQLLARESIEADLADSSYGRTPLSWAAARGHAEVVQLLLDTHTVNLLSRDRFYNRTPSMWAAVYGYCDIAKLLHFVETEQSGQATPAALVLDGSPLAPFEEPQEISSSFPWSVPALIVTRPTPSHTPAGSDTESVDLS